MTADARYAYAIAYANPDNGPGAYNGWTYRVYDPRDNWALVDEVRTGTSSYYTDGLISDGNYLYPMEWTGGSAQRAYRIRIVDGLVEDLGYNYPAQHITGQYEPNTETVYTSTLRFGPQLHTYSASNGWQPPALRTGTINIDPVVGDGFGSMGTDGTYVYGVGWGSYPGPDRLARVGGGENGTAAGAFYGFMTTDDTGHDARWLRLRWLLLRLGERRQHAAARVRISEAVSEVCGGGDEDCDGVSNEPGSLGCVTYFRDADDDGYGVAGDAQCLCAPQGDYTATRDDVFDCDDGAIDINPGETETIGDGIDSNCDALELCYVDDDQDFYHAGEVLLTAELGCPTSSGWPTTASPAATATTTTRPSSRRRPSPATTSTTTVTASSTRTTRSSARPATRPSARAATTASSSATPPAPTSRAARLPWPPTTSTTAAAGSPPTRRRPRSQAHPPNDLQLLNGADFSSTARSGTAVRFDGVDDYARGTEWGAAVGAPELQRVGMDPADAPREHASTSPRHRAQGSAPAAGAGASTSPMVSPPSSTGMATPAPPTRASRSPRTRGRTSR